MIRNDMRFISRHENVSGWRVYVARNKKTVFHKYFLDAEYTNALQSAKRYRNKIEDYIESLSKSIFSGYKTPPFFRHAKPNSKTQIVGVTRQKGLWRARWNSEPYVQESVCFSIKEYGEQIAKELAITTRIEGITQRFERENLRVFIPRPNFEQSFFTKIGKKIKNF